MSAQENQRTPAPKKLFYCHCDKCKVVAKVKSKADVPSASAYFVNRQDYAAHRRNNKFNGLKYKKWKMSFGKYNMC